MGGKKIRGSNFLDVKKNSPAKGDAVNPGFLAPPKSMETQTSLIEVYVRTDVVYKELKLSQDVEGESKVSDSEKAVDVTGRSVKETEVETNNRDEIKDKTECCVAENEATSKAKLLIESQL